MAPNAVYTYFPDKATIERAMIERLLGELAESKDQRPRAAEDTTVGKGAAGAHRVAVGPGSAGGDGNAAGEGARVGNCAMAKEQRAGWRVGVEEHALDLRRLLLLHPGVLAVLIGSPMDAPSALALGERLLDALAAGGLDAGSAARGSYVLIAYVLGSIALEVAGWRTSVAFRRRMSASRLAGGILAGALVETLPRTASAIPVLANRVGTEQFVWGLHRVLDGLELQVRRG